MPRAMSFWLTEAAFKDGTKDVTRRLGWSTLARGDVLKAVRKAQGLRAGERQELLGLIRVVSTRRERLDAITLDEVRREGFAGKTPADFIRLFCEANRCEPSTVVTRIEFERLQS